MKGFRKSKYLIACFAAAALTIGIGSTSALLKVQATEVKNVFESAKINVQIVEVLPDGSGTQGSDTNNAVDFGTICRDNPVSKEVCVENLHSEEYPTTDTFVRCRIVPILRDEEGNNTAEDISLRLSGMGQGWKIEELNGEYYYYWTKELGRGEKTNALFEKVTVTSDIPEGAHLELQVLVDAVQARPYPSTGFGGLPSDQREKEGMDIPSYTAWKWYYDGTTLTNDFY